MNLSSTSYEGETELVAGVSSALEARIAENKGFDAIWVSSLGVSLLHGVPDQSVVGPKEMENAARSIEQAVDIPVIVDCDTGYGDEQNVYFTVQRFEQTGVDAICVEDKKFPKRNSFSEGNEQIPKEEFQRKIEVAEEAIRNENFSFIARVESLITGAGIEDAIERANAYAKAGADALVIHSKQSSPEAVWEVCGSINTEVPIILIPTTYDVSLEEINNHPNITAVIYANHAFRAAIPAMKSALGSIRETGDDSQIGNELATLDDLFKLQGLDELKSNLEGKNDSD